MPNAALRPTPSTRTITEYAELKRIIRAHGLLDARPGYYVMKAVVTAALLCATIATVLLSSHIVVLMLSAVFLAFVSTQIAFLAHDTGHRQGFRGRRTNAIARYFLGNVVLGVSQSWWNGKHNQHHVTPNHIDDDPDIQFPMIVFSEAQIADRPVWLRPVIAVQAFVFPLLLPLQALNMRVSSIQHIATMKRSRGKWLEGALVAVHVGLYAALVASIGDWQVALAFFAVHQATFGVYNSSVFASNHKGMPVTTGKEEWGFLREQVLTSRNVTGHPLTDFWSGGLNYQIEHHLFPTMPRNRLRRAQGLVEQFCVERGIPYHKSGFLQSYGEIFAHLHRVSAPMRWKMRMLTPKAATEA